MAKITDEYIETEYLRRFPHLNSAGRMGVIKSLTVMHKLLCEQEDPQQALFDPPEPTSDEKETQPNV